MDNEKEIQKKNILTARKEAIQQLKLYIKEQKEEYLQNAFDLDNTNSYIIYYKLNDLKSKDPPKYKDLSQKYKLFLNKDDAEKLNIPYINHKEDVLKIFDSIQIMDSSNPNDIVILKDSLYKHYPKEHKNILDLYKKERIYNIPLNLFDDLTFFLKVKIKLGKHLYNFVDNLYKTIIKINKEDEEIDEKEIDDDEEDEKEKEEEAIDFYKELVPYIKIYTEIILFYINKNDRKLVYCLLSKANFSLVNIGAKQQIAYYLNKMHANLEEISKKYGFNFEYKKYDDHCSEEISTKLLDNYRQLFFDTIEKILKSKCIQQLINKLITQDKDDKNIIVIDNNFIKYLKENILFHKFFDDDDYGFTNAVDGIIVINSLYRYISNFRENENLLFIFCLMIIAAIHQIIGHFLKEYYYYSTKFYITDISPIKDGKKEEGDCLVEDYLFKGIKEINISDVLYILDILNWDKNLEDFNKFFNSDLREHIIEKERLDLNSFIISKECLKFLLNFNIQTKDLKKIRTDISVEYGKRNNNIISMKLSRTRCSNDKKNKWIFKKNNNS